MAIYHCSVKIGSRGKGQSAVAAAAYRSGSKLTDKEIGITSDYTRKGGVIFSEISLCPNAPAEYSDREILWNAVHQIEKTKDARLWREIEVALPKELNRAEQIETVREYVKGLTTQGMCADWSLHDKGDGNPHAHIMLTVRSIEPSGKWAPKSRKVYDLDENGERIFQKIDKSGRKQYKCHKEDYNNWNAAERVEEWRAAWAECCNAHLAADAQVDHRSYERQGIDLIPTVHEGYIARKLAAQGLPSDRVQMNEDIRKRNSLLQRLMSQLKALGNEILRLSGLREAAEVKNDVIISTFDGANKFANEKPKSQVQAPSPRKIVQRELSQEEIRSLANLKHQYIFQYCANEYLKNNGELKYSAKNEYEKSQKMIDNYTRTINEYYNIETQIENTINPIRKISLRKELAAQGMKACDAAREIGSYFKTTLYYNNRKLSTNNVTYDHLYAIKSYTNYDMSQKKAAMEKEKKNNEIRQHLKSRNISDDSVNSAYKNLVAAVAAVPDEQCELALKYVNERTGYFSFEEYGYNSEHRLAALKGVEKAISRLYEGVKRINYQNQPQEQQRQELKNHIQYDGLSI